MKKNDLKISQELAQSLDLTNLWEETQRVEAKRLIVRKPREKKRLNAVETDALATKLINRAVKQRSVELTKSPDYRTIRSTSLAESAFGKFERIVGGREKLIDALSIAPPDQSYAKMVGKFLSDEGIMTDPLHLIAIRQRTPIAILVQAYRDAKALMLHLEAIEKLAKKVPIMSEQIATDSLNRWEKCLNCSGSGRSEVILGGEFAKDELGQPRTVVCIECRGSGKVYKEHSIKNRQLLVDITGLVEKKPLIEQTFDQRHQTLNANFTPGDGNFEQLMKATDKLLRPTHVQQVIDIKSSDGDRIQAPDQAEGTLDG